MPSIIDNCEAKGIRYLGLTDHLSIYTDPSIFQRENRKISNSNSNIKVYLGVEVDILDIGKHAMHEDVLENVDYVIAASNHYWKPEVNSPSDGTLHSIGKHILDMFEYACSLDFADFVAHPMVIMQNMYDSTCLDLLTDKELEKAIRVAVENNTAVEISPRALAPSQRYFLVRFYSICKNMGVKFAIGSDGHNLKDAGRTDILGSLIKEIGIENDDIWLPEVHGKNLNK
ncbi:MAG: hypothetical protein SNJ70_07355 [Armatimonadota bacterium]